jgi:hypothetical protein
MNTDTTKQADPIDVIEVAQAELELIVTGLKVRSGLQAGLSPCI